MNSILVSRSQAARGLVVEAARRGRLLWVTGIDTGVGKTLLARLLVAWGRGSGRDVRAVKPFCAGSMDDIKEIDKVQSDIVGKWEVCRCYVRRPLAPWVAARQSGLALPARGEVIEWIGDRAAACDGLVVEGAGGLATPLGQGYSALELIEASGGGVVVVGTNRLGVISQTRLAVIALQNVGVQSIGVVLMDRSRADAAMRSNAWALRELLGGAKVWRLPWYGNNSLGLNRIQTISKNIQKTLAQIFRTSRLCTLHRA